MKTVLVIDDNTATCNLVEQVLKPLGVHVIRAGNGAAAMEMTRCSKPDVIVMNTRLPGMNGLEVAEAIKSDDSLKHIPIIVLTATIMSREKVTRIEAFDGYIGKPFNPAELRECVSRFL